MTYPTISARAQRFMLWWGFLMMLAFGLSYGFLIKLIVPPKWLISIVPTPPRSGSAR
jgi:hypothetical protein